MRDRIVIAEGEVTDTDGCLTPYGGLYLASMRFEDKCDEIQIDMMTKRASRTIDTSGHKVIGYLFGSACFDGGRGEKLAP